LNKQGVLLLGEGLILHGVRDKVLELGHEVVAQLTTSDLVQQPDGTYQPLRKAEIDDFVANNPCDVLLSVANPYILAPSTIARPRLAAINYHNAPLPSYAGLRATAWAIANGEREHGITWHLVEPRVDAGAVLVQKMFALADGETTASLDSRCAVEALAGMDALFDLLAEGKLHGSRQDGARRSYYGRQDIVPQAGILDPAQSVQEIVQLVRACDWGAGVNDFGSTKLVGGAALPAIVLDAKATDGTAAIGTILEADGATFTLACADGAVKLSLDRAINMAPGSVLPPSQCGALAEELADYGTSLLQERAKLPLYRDVALLTAGNGPAGRSGSITTSGHVDSFLKAVSRVLGPATICAAEADGGSVGLLHDWRPFRANDGPGEGGLPPCRDIHRRWPSLKGFERWPHSAMVRILRSNLANDLPPGGIAFSPEGIIHYRDVEATAKAVAQAMTVPKPDAVAEDAGDTVPMRLLAVARQHPHATAIEEDGTTTTYAALVEKSLAVSAVFLAAGIESDDSVGVLLPASAAFVTTALGVMLAGAAYVPLDPASPAQRLLLEIEESGVLHIVTSREFGTRLPATQVPILFIEEVTAPGSRLALPAAAAHTCAYRIFTSGSTGRPKAVEVTHAALMHLVRHCCTALPLSGNDRMTMLARSTFDASVADMWPILTVGGTLLSPPSRILLDPSCLLQWLATARATCSSVPTAIAERLLHMPQPAGIRLHTLITGGDTLHRRPPPGLPYRLINSYGPTENTVGSLWSVVAPGEGRPTIGRPIAGVTVQILDEFGRPVRPGEIGELLLGGAQIARGYFGRPELTAERFVTNEAGERFYRTGDRVCLGPDGDFEFHGRIDDQVQILGIRVEPGEIEAMLVTDARVAEAACLPLRVGNEIAGLIAFVLPAAPPADDSQLALDLRGLLKESLPAAMVPKIIRIEQDLPYRSSGKIDRNALSLRAAKVDGPCGDALDKAWRRALPHARDGEVGDFWELGGDSLAAIAFLTELETLSGVKISAGSFLADPTLVGVRRLLNEVPNSSAIEIRGGSPPIFVCWYGVRGDVEVYQHLLKHLPGQRIIGIESPGVRDENNTPGSIEQAAAIGLADLEGLVGNDPLILLGFSFGGLLAFEAGRQLAARDKEPLLVCLFGTTPPVRSRSKWSRLSYLGRRLPHTAWRVLRRQRGVNLSWSAVPRELLRAMGLRRSAPALPGWAQSAIEQQHIRMAEHYQPAVATLPIRLFRETQGKDNISLRYYVRNDLEDLGWSEWVDSKLKVHWIDSDHDSLLHRSVGDIASILVDELASRGDEIELTPSSH
jgi:amino acid adenylation domain-containing protein